MLLYVQVVSSKVKSSAELPPRQESFSVSNACTICSASFVEIGICMLYSSLESAAAEDIQLPRMPTLAGQWNINHSGMGPPYRTDCYA